jgi:hypothetical protein
MECGWSFDDLVKHSGLEKTTILRHVNEGASARPATLKTYADTFKKHLSRNVTVAELQL